MRLKVKGCLWGHLVLAPRNAWKPEYWSEKRRLLLGGGLASILLQALASTFFFSKSRGTHDHVLLSHDSGSLATLRISLVVFLFSSRFLSRTYWRTPKDIMKFTSCSCQYLQKARLLKQCWSIAAAFLNAIKVLFVFLITRANFNFLIWALFML
jgi:hypothetical protein